MLRHFFVVNTKTNEVVQAFKFNLKPEEQIGFEPEDGSEVDPDLSLPMETDIDIFGMVEELEGGKKILWTEADGFKVVDVNPIEI